MRAPREGTIAAPRLVRGRLEGGGVWSRGGGGAATADDARALAFFFAFLPVVGA